MPNDNQEYSPDYFTRLLDPENKTELEKAEVLGRSFREQGRMSPASFFSKSYYQGRPILLATAEGSQFYFAGNRFHKR